MNTLILASFGTVILTIGLVSVSVLLIGLILLQKNRGSGLSGAFGGVGGHTAFGTKTGDFLTWVTVSLTAVFLLLSIAGNYVFETGKSATAAQPSQQPAAPVSQTDGPPMGAMPSSPPMTLPQGTPAPANPPGAAPAPVNVKLLPTTQPS